MAMTRVTQRMMAEHSLSSLQLGLGRLSQLQEQLSTGRRLNRPSDSPSDTGSALRMRAARAQQQQYQNNAQDGLAWLGQTDTTLGTVTDQLNRAHDLALQGANSGSAGQDARDALATEVDQIRQAVLGDANTAYLGRPIFGGTTAGSAAYDASGTYVGDAGQVTRTVGDGQTVRVDVAATSAFGVDGDNVFDHLAALSTALRANDAAGISAGLTSIAGDVTRVTTARASAGGVYNRIDTANKTATSAEDSLTTSLSDVENVDLPKAMMDVQLQQVAYQAALGSTAKVIQPSLLDFLR